MNKIEFYTTNADYGCFSNFSRHPIKINGKLWKTTEHYYQAQKFAGTKFESKIMKCNSPGDAARLGRSRSLPLRKDWESVKDSIMEEAVYAKFTQHESLKKILLSTDDSILVEHTENDSYWGDGGDGSGKNMLGITLMKVRNRIKNEK